MSSRVFFRKKQKNRAQTRSLAPPPSLASCAFYTLCCLLISFMDSVSYLLSRAQRFSSLAGSSQNRNRRKSEEEVDDNVKHSHCDQKGLVTGFSFLGSLSVFSWHLLSPSLYLLLSLALSLSLSVKERPDPREKNP